MREQIQDTLTEIERENGVRVLYAVESGSRAWGFASPNSDYDVRFLYAHPYQEYLRIDPPRDVIERPLIGDLDIHGWDIFKALRLFRASNPSMLEWLYSPIIYRSEGNFAEALRQLVPSSISMRKLGYHYLSMARSNYKDYISGKTEVSLKKYLYALRPLICLLWLEQQGNPPPTDFVEARNGTDFAPEIRARIDTMIARKSRQGELGAGPAEAILDAFIVSHLERFERLVPGLPDVRFEVEPLNRIAWDVLEVAGR